MTRATISFEAQDGRLDLLASKSDVLALESDVKAAIERQTLELIVRLGIMIIAGLVIEALLLLHLVPPD